MDRDFQDKLPPTTAVGLSDDPNHDRGDQQALFCLGGGGEGVGPLPGHDSGQSAPRTGIRADRGRPQLIRPSEKLLSLYPRAIANPGSAASLSRPAHRQEQSAQTQQ